jgi:hypothetical protein
MSDLSPETRRLLNMARDADALPTSRRVHMKAKLFARIAAVPVFTTTAAAAGASGTTMSIFGVVVKGIAGVALVASVGAGSYLAVRDTRQAPHVRPPVAPTMLAAAPESQEPGPSPLAARPSAPPRMPFAAPAAMPLEARGKRATTMAVPLRTPAPVARPAQRVSQNGPAPASNDSNLTGVEPLVAPTPTLEPIPAPPQSTLAEETRLLREADQALRAGNSERALTLLDEHATRFPNGVLEPERSAEQLIAACKTGKGDSSTVKQYLAAHPGSAFSARIQQACGAKTTK